MPQAKFSEAPALLLESEACTYALKLAVEQLPTRLDHGLIAQLEHKIHM